MEKKGTDIEEIFFIPNFCNNEFIMFTEQLYQKNNKAPEITLMARHRSMPISGNGTVVQIVKTTPRYERNNNRLHQMDVETEGGGRATLALDYPEHKFTVLWSNQKFNEEIISSFQLV